MFAPILRQVLTFSLFYKGEKLKEVKSYARAWHGQAVDPSKMALKAYILEYKRQSLW